MLTIREVESGSVAQDYGFEEGDKIISINSTPCMDVIDYTYFDLDSDMVIEVETVQGERVEVEIHKDFGEPLGLSFLEKITPTCCKNKCIFCFVDQLPLGMRESLYLKDDVFAR